MRGFGRFQQPAMAVAAALLVAGTSWAQCPADDTFEDNDDCFTSSVAATGLTSGLVVTGAASGLGVDDDFWVIQGVPAGQLLTVDVLFTHVGGTGDIDITLYDDLGCTVQLSGGYSVTDNEQAGASNGTGAAKDYYLRVYGYSSGFDCNDYDLQVTIAPDPCQQVGLDDSLEENDSCAAAVALAAGTHTGLFVSTADEDYYKITVAPGDQLTIDQTYSSANVELNMELFDDPACTNFVAGAGWGAGFNSLFASNSSGAPMDFFLRCHVVDGDCGTYDLTVATNPDPCLAPGLDDSFEDNDDCGSAAALPIGSHTGLFIADSDLDYYAITVPAGEQLTIDQNYAGTVELYIDLYSDPSCTTYETGAGWGAGVNSLTWSNGSAAPATVYLSCGIDNVTGSCTNYDLNLTSAPDPCFAPGLDDSFEDNDDCGTAAVMAAGSHTGLFIAFGDEDYYAITVPAGDQLTIDQTYAGLVELYMDLYSDSSCTTYLSGAGWGAGLNSLVWANNTGAAATVYLSCQIDDFTGTCTNYDLNVTLAPDPCQTPGADDAFEDNDDCANTTPLADGTFPGLFVAKGDDDYYEVNVADGDTLFVDLTFTHAQADVDVYLYDDQIACGDLNNYLVNGFSASDNENISWTNTSGALQTYYILVVVYANSQGDCNDYDMTISGSGGSLATPFCFGDGTADVGAGQVGCPCGNNSALGAGEGCNSSLGFGAILTTGGTSIVANDDLTFSITQARPNQPGLLVQGSTLIAVPFKDGVLCMGNPTERVEVVILDANGEGTTSSSIVTEGNVTAGDTRYYQMWYRDPGGISPCGSGSNFSQGLMLTWM